MLGTGFVISRVQYIVSVPLQRRVLLTHLQRTCKSCRAPVTRYRITFYIGLPNQIRYHMQQCLILPLILALLMFGMYRIQPVTRPQERVGLIFISHPKRSDFPTMARIGLPWSRVTGTPNRCEKESGTRVILLGTKL